MNILYYTWRETQAADCIECMRSFGHQVHVFDKLMTSYTKDDSFEAELSSFIMSFCQNGNKFDALYSFNYFPAVSNVCNRHGLTYISWVFDSPHLTLESRSLNNPCNKVYIFDKALYDYYVGAGINTVNYLPLGYYASRINPLTQSLSNKPYMHDVSFIGNLYNDQYNFLDQIEHMPAYLRGYIDGIINAQLDLQGFDIVDSLFNDALCDELGKYATLDMGSDYNDCKNIMFKNMIRRKATSIERPRLLTSLGRHFDVALYAGSPPPSDLPVKYMGYAESLTVMPTVFNRSKINLNITLRTIQTGLPLRILDILGAGGFCITNYQAELSDYFENGVDLVWYESEDDLIEKVNYYLDPAHEEERQMIARRGHEKVSNEFCYEKLLKRILDESYNKL